MKPDFRTALMIAHGFPPISTAGVFRTLRFVKYLPEFGWRPVVIASPSRRGTVVKDDGLLKQVPEGTIVERPDMLNPEGWIGSLFHSGGNGPQPDATAARAANVAQSVVVDAPRAPRRWREWVKTLQELLFHTPDEYIWWALPAARAALRAVEQTNPEVIYTTGPPHSTHVAGLLVRQMTGLPWVADFRDPWSRQPWGQKRNLWGAKLLPFIESECIRHATCVILNTGRMAQDFRRHYHSIRGSKFVALPNGFDPELKGVVEGCLRSAPETPPGGPLALCHPGSLYHRRDMRPLVDAVRLLAERGLAVRVENIGDCPCRQELSTYAAEAGVPDSFVFSEPVKHREVLQRMAGAEVLVVIQPNNDLQVPGKLYEMMLFGKPILALADEGEVSDLVRRYELGESARSNDASAIAGAIARLAERARASARPVPNPVALEAFDGRLLSARLAGMFSSLVRDFGRDRATVAQSQGANRHDSQRHDEPFAESADRGNAPDESSGASASSPEYGRGQLAQV